MTADEKENYDLIPSGFNFGYRDFKLGFTTRNNRLFFFFLFFFISCLVLAYATHTNPVIVWFLVLFVITTFVFLSFLLVKKPQMFDSEEHIEYMNERSLQGDKSVGLQYVHDGELYTIKSDKKLPLPKNDNKTKALIKMEAKGK